MTSIALVTCRELPDWEVDDEPLRAELRRVGVALEEPVWSDLDVDWSRFQQVVIRTTWDYVGRIEAFREWVRRCGAVTRLHNPPQVVEWNLDKRYLRALASRGTRTIPTLWLERIEDLERDDWRRWLGEHGATRGFLKPVVGASAHGTLRFDADGGDVEEAERFMRDALVGGGGLGSAPMPIKLQPYQPVVEEEGELSAVVIDGVLTHGVRKTPVPGDYRVQDDWGGTDRPHSFTPAERRVIEDVLDAALDAVEADARVRLDRPLLYARADFLRADDGGLQLVELELVEPSLFFRHGPDAAQRMAKALSRGAG